MTVVAAKRHCVRRPSSIVLRIGMTALMAHILASGALAQIDPSSESEDVDSPGLVIEAAAGFDGIVDLSTPVPLSFLIRNDSDQMVEGHLRLSDPTRGHEVSLGEVVVAPGTARRVTSIRAMADWFECFATLRSGAQVLWRRELPLQTGNEFSENVNFALFIDDGGRSLELPGAVSATTALAASQVPVAGKEGRPIQCLTVKSWQVPNHFGPLVAVQAIIFPEGAPEDQLNQVQWRAVAEWMCQGGAVFVHAESAEIIDRLTRSAPLDAEPAGPSSDFVVRRIGLGAIYEYAEPLLPSAGSATRQRIGESIARLKKNHISTFLESANWYHRRGGRADMNRVLVVMYFGLYTFFSGVVALLLFRLSQRRMGAYTVFVVVGACVLSGVLGGYLRHSRGDLHWITVTQAGAGGVVQVGQVEVHSAGGRNTHVAVRGERADLQFIGVDQRYGPWYRPQTGCPPFTWQPNLAPAVDDTYQVHVTMTPWGRRRLHATAFQPGVRPLEFKLEFQPGEPAAAREGAPVEATQLPAGVLSVKIVNHLPFDLKECWLIVGVTCTTSEQAVVNQPIGYGPYGMPGAQAAVPIDGLIDAYHRRQFPRVSAGATHVDTFEAEFEVVRNTWDQMIHLPGGAVSPPRIARLGAASAWIIALIDDSPIMSIDEQRTDFVPQEHVHLFVQEILPEEMPNAELFLGGVAADASDGAKDGMR